MGGGVNVTDLIFCQKIAIPDKNNPGPMMLTMHQDLVQIFRILYEQQQYFSFLFPQLSYEMRISPREGKEYLHIAKGTS